MEADVIPEADPPRPDRAYCWLAMKSVLTGVTRRPLVGDAGLLLGLLALTLLLSDRIFAPLLRAALWDPVHVWWLVSAVALVSVLVRHRWPAVTFLVGLSAALAHLAIQRAVPFEPTPVDAVALIGLYTVAAGRHRRLAVGLLVVGLAAAAGWHVHAVRTDQANTVVVAWAGDGTVRPESPPVLSPEQHLAVERSLPPYLPHTERLTVYVGGRVPTWGGFVMWALLLLLAWSLGHATRDRRLHLAALRRRAEDLERERDTQARLAAVAERARISRELHDVVAHGLSVVVLQAQGGAAELDRMPERTRQALGAIVDTGRLALAETRRLLGALGQDVAWVPPPSVRRLPHLVEQVRAAGLPVELRIEGEPRPLPSTVDLAGCRIVQEALTNTLKHAGVGAAATVVLRYGASALRVEVRDNGRGPSGTSDEPGSGLRGMRERVAVLGGQFHAGPADDGGFLVRARLPLEVPTG
jgi:signal transduction histidine kinase